MDLPVTTPILIKSAQDSCQPKQLQMSPNLVIKFNHRHVGKTNWQDFTSFQSDAHPANKRLLIHCDLFPLLRKQKKLQKRKSACLLSEPPDDIKTPNTQGLVQIQDIMENKMLNVQNESSFGSSLHRETWNQTVFSPLGHLHSSCLNSLWKGR